VTASPSRQKIRTEEIDWAALIARYRRPDGSVIVPPRVAKSLDDRAGMAYEARIRLRASDPEGYAVFAALRLAALDWDGGVPARTPPVSDNGHRIAFACNGVEHSETWTTTAEVARHVGVTERTVRRWAEKKWLPADRPGGRQWLIHVNDLSVAQALAAA
jgi:excisionase family DNA binding protein